MSVVPRSVLVFFYGDPIASLSDAFVGPRPGWRGLEPANCSATCRSIMRPLGLEGWGAHSPGSDEVGEVLHDFQRCAFLLRSELPPVGRVEGQPESVLSISQQFQAAGTGKVEEQELKEQFAAGEIQGVRPESCPYEDGSLVMFRLLCEASTADGPAVHGPPGQIRGIATGCDLKTILSAQCPPSTVPFLCPQSQQR